MRNRGFSLIELLVAVLLLALAVSGLIVLWGFGFNTTAHSQDIGIAYSIARQEIEGARGRGYMALPNATWEVGYDGKGCRSTDANPRFIAKCVGAVIPFDGDVEDSRCLRTLTVEVKARGRVEPVFTTMTYFTEGGV